MLCLFILALGSALHARDFDSYKLRISGVWFYSNPSGDLQGSNETGTINLQKDLGFNGYSTSSGKLDGNCIVGRLQSRMSALTENWFSDHMRSIPKRVFVQYAS